MSHLPLVSVLICTYNASATIQETLLSCLEQTYNNIEILIHDDQSTDNTLDIIKNLNNPLIKVIPSGKKLGPYKGLNFLLDHAKGEYIAIQDHDDLRISDKIQQQITFLESELGKKYIGCGTKTRMRYEGDNRYFDYYIGAESSYTLHPSLVFRNKGCRYPDDTIYMNDARFQKFVLGKEQEKIYNIDHMLTIHRIKSGAKNYSYKWFQFTKKNITTLFALHPRWYAGLALAREGMRKIVYPLLQKIGKGGWIDKIERVPFVLQGYEIEKNY